jgi:hypothetical protein
MRQIPMLTTVAQNQMTWELEFSDPLVNWFATPLSTSEFPAAFFYSVHHLLSDSSTRKFGPGGNF